MQNKNHPYKNPTKNKLNNVLGDLSRDENQVVKFNKEKENFNERN